ncbi:7-keto-8-aminopelargonate synthetase-like enzyme [Pseudomonas cichorii]|uniref:7-keto-8-aminopelargonate synthetase-like enzyme n=1 Tax=Pseudomonas cichorii TaxID=36746 RepID=A0A3M4LIJ2_PSECI|nr:aminotransferase class I/II-fold pyridoxal phosphate-dependent enzyme [Pseudomonas cichorii]RMQ41292.1 7-keto-8-aminopelargonate synthetase-like enzyme [Pseudomonas cichorii]
MNTSTNRYSNYQSMVRLAEANWNEAENLKLSNLQVSVEHTNYLKDQFGRYFHHFCTTSYLGLDYHPALLEGAVQAIQKTGTLRIANSRNRCKLASLAEYEFELSELFNTSCHVTLSCSSASSGILPLLASGVFTSGRPPVMVFDKHAHYSMNHIKAACSDETEVMTLNHNDMEQLETLCKSHKRIAYIADGVYSMGGVADMESLVYLKQKYGMFLYLDDSHALTALGANGVGHARSYLPTLDDSTIIVASLGKAFGAGGGVAMLGSEQQKKLIHRYGGPSNWSQSLNTAAIGAGRASITLHRTGEIDELQKQLQRNIQHFDSLITTEHAGSHSPIRLICCTDANAANQIAAKLSNNGFFTSAVFFPVVARNKPAIRITLRADMSPALINEFCTFINHILYADRLEPHIVKSTLY